MNAQPPHPGLSLGATGAHRPTLLGTRHMAVSGHYAASHAAFAILEAGGNAVDAGVAAGIVLAVVQCDLVNFAGVAPIILYDSKTASVHTIAGLGPWPRRTDVQVFRHEYSGRIPHGILRSVVPGAPSAWITALRRFGTMSFGEVASTAIRLACDGFPMYPLLADMIALHENDYRRWPSNASVFLPQGRPPRTGEILVQRDLAGTLQYLADEERSASSRGRDAGLEAAHAAFYQGDIAATIDRFFRQEGGWLQADDLKKFTAPVEPAVTGSFAGVDLHVCGPWTQGPVLLQALGLLDPGDLRRFEHNSPQYIHTVVEALKLSFADRERYYGDPQAIHVPLGMLLSDENRTTRRSMIDPDRAAPGLPVPSGSGTHLQDSASASGEPGPPGDTSFVCVVDRHGNAFAATPSDTSYDSVMVPGTGLCPSSRGSQGYTDPAHPGYIVPGRRPRLTCNPALAIKKGKWIMPFGTPGGDVQCQAMLQVILNRVIFGHDLQVAVEAPRFATYSFPNSFDPHDYFPARLALEGRFPTSVGNDLRARGHDVHSWPDWTWLAGAVCAASTDLLTGVHAGAADPRRASYAVGW